MQSGLALFRKAFETAGVQVIAVSPLRDRGAMLCEVGALKRSTKFVLTDAFVQDLVGSTEYQRSLEDYASALAMRVCCGSPDIYYCQSGIPIQVDIDWPIQYGIFGDSASSWVRIDLTDKASDAVAVCSLQMSRFRIGRGEIGFDLVRPVVNLMRAAVDEKVVVFGNPDVVPSSFQHIRPDFRSPLPPRSQHEIEQFLAGKAYYLGFRVVDVLGPVWIVDPWDAEYLGTSPKLLAQAAQILRARGWINIDSGSNLASATDKFLGTGWPLPQEARGTETIRHFSLSQLPKKAELVREVNSLIKSKLLVTLLVVDLDHFKVVNDNKGHSEGDACLERIVSLIGGILGARGNLYRWGGDEFVVALPYVSTEEAHATAERVRRAVEQEKPGGDVSVTTSIGIGGSDRFPSSTAEELLNAADKAMYVSKQRGKNRVTVWPIQD